MKINDITDVFFDLDHTLWDFDKNSAFTFHKLFKIHHIKLDLNIFLSHYEPINLKYWKLYREEKIDKQTLRFNRLYDAFQAVNYHVQANVIDKLSQDYITHLPSFNHLFENTFEILEYLNQNYNLHIITNGFEEVQHKKLDKSKIIQYFKTITNSEMVGVKKPNPKIFNFALQQAKTVAKNSIMIGDSYEADILGAKNIGMQAIYFGNYNDAIDTEIKQVTNLIHIKKYL